MNLAKIKKIIPYVPFVLTSYFITRLIPYDSGKSISAELQQEISVNVNRALKQHNIPGAIVGVWTRDDGLWLRAFGKSDIFSGKDLRWNEKMRIGSITKTFTATVALQLIQDRKIRLDEPLANYIPAIPQAAKITIRQLLNHTSGIFDYTSDKDFWPKVFANPLKTWSPQELVDIAATHPLNFVPGTSWGYSNTNYVLLGMIIEMATGRKIEDEIRRRILEPLDLKRTTFPDYSYIEGEYSHGYMDRDASGKLNDVTILDPSFAWSAGAMISDLQDLAIWARILESGRLLSVRMKEEQFNFVDTGQPHLKYGLGVARFGDFIGHDGGIPGYNSAMFYLPSRDTIIIVLLNRFSDTNVAMQLFMKIAKIVVPADAPW